MSTSSPSDSDPRNPKTILQTCNGVLQHFVNEQLPSISGAIWELPSKTFQLYAERDKRFDARQGPIGNPFQGFVDPGLTDGIEERRKRYEEYLREKQEEKKRQQQIEEQ